MTGMKARNRSVGATALLVMMVGALWGCANDTTTNHADRPSRHDVSPATRRAQARQFRSASEEVCRSVNVQIADVVGVPMSSEQFLGRVLQHEKAGLGELRSMEAPEALKRWQGRLIAALATRINVTERMMTAVLEERSVSRGDMERRNEATYAANRYAKRLRLGWCPYL